MGDTIYTPAVPLFSSKDSVKLPQSLNPLPLFPEKTPAYVRFLLSPFKRRRYLFNEDYFTYIHHLKAWVAIPKNFVFDFASVLQVIPGMVHDGIFAYGSAPHDFGYRFGGLYLSKGPGHPFIYEQLSRKDLDLVFKTMNDASNKLPKLNEAARIALRLFGKRNFKAYDVTKVDWSKPVFSRPT